MIMIMIMIIIIYLFMAAAVADDMNPNAGHLEVEPPGEPGDEEGLLRRRVHDDGFLRALWLSGLRCLRQRGSRQLPHRFRLLRALLARRHRQRVHRRPSGRRLPGSLPEPASPLSSPLLDVTSLNYFLPVGCRRAMAF